MTAPPVEPYKAQLGAMRVTCACGGADGAARRPCLSPRIGISRKTRGRPAARLYVRSTSDRRQSRRRTHDEEFAAASFRQLPDHV